MYLYTLGTYSIYYEVLYRCVYIYKNENDRMVLPNLYLETIFSIALQ